MVKLSWEVYEVVLVKSGMDEVMVIMIVFFEELYEVGDLDVISDDLVIVFGYLLLMLVVSIKELLVK